MDAPNQALEKMVGMIGLPCKYGARGCSELVFLPSRLQHETLCRSKKISEQQQQKKTTENNNNKKQQQQQPILRFRPTECQYTQNGCDQVFAYKVTPNID